MKLSKLAFLNIQHNIKKYIMYMFAMVFCVFTTHSFFTIAYSEEVQAALTRSISWRNTFIAFSIITIIFVAFFLISSNNSFLRARKKEISTYALFGMTSTKIAGLLMIEVLLLGISALIIGIIISSFFSKLLLMILVKITAPFHSGEIPFLFETKAMSATIMIYIGIFFLMGITGMITISRFQLVDLFKAEKVAERKYKGAKLMMIIAIVFIISGYLLSSFGTGSDISALMIPIIVIVIIGTFLFFLGGLKGFMDIMKAKNFNKYDGIKMTAYAMISHRTKTISAMMATITVLIAMGTTAISVGYTLYKNAEFQTYESLGFDLIYKNDEQLDSEINRYFENGSLEDSISFIRYKMSPKIENAPESRKSFVQENPIIEVCSQSDYNAIIKKTKDRNEPIEVGIGEVHLIDDNFGLNYNGSDQKSWLGSDIIVGTESYNVASFSKVGYNFGVIIVAVLNDADFNHLLDENNIYMINGDVKNSTFTGINYYNALTDYDAALKLTEIIGVGKVKNGLAFDGYNYKLSVFGLITFVGFFMCALFIFMTASMLYFKQVTLATEEKNQFEALRKIGMDKDMQNQIIKRKLLPVFLIPLIVGILHSVFALKAGDAMVFDNIIPNMNSYLVVMKYSLLMYLLYSLIYTVFYFVTKNQYRQIISSQ